MKKLAILFLLLSTGIFFSVSAQKRGQSGKPNVNLIMGDKHFDNMEYYLAANEYARVLKADSNNAYAMFQLAECYRHYYNYKAAELYYHKVAMRYRNSYPLARYWYAAMLKDNGNYKKAIENFEQYRKECMDTDLETGLFRERALNEIKGCHFAIAENSKPRIAYNFRCLPAPVNSHESDYSPVLIQNDSVLALTSSRRSTTGNHDNSLGASFSEVYRFSKKNDSIWEEIKHTDKDDFFKLNSSYNDCSGSFTRDQKKYYFTRCDEMFKADNYQEMNCAIYVSQNKNGKWDNPVKLNSNINAPEQWNAQPSVSADGNILFFVSKRQGGFGMHDIWYSTCNGDDLWGPPVNLGPGVNTLFSDVSPRYYSDEKVLFFSSTGHGGYGALDIYLTREENGFESSVNIGYPFNTNRDDFYFVMGENKGYITSNREGGEGSDDIYTFSFKSKKSLIYRIEDSTVIDDAEILSKPAKVTREETIAEIPVNKYNDKKFAHVNGVVVDSITNKPVKNLEINVVDEYGDPLQKTVTNENGRYRFYNLPTNQEYKIVMKNPDAANNAYRQRGPKVEYSGWTITPVAEPESLEEPEIQREILITAVSKDTIRDKKSFAVSGTITDSAGAVLKKGQVQLIDEFENVMEVSDIDSAGRYRVERTADTKSYKVLYKFTAKASEKINTSWQLSFEANTHVPPHSTDALIAIISKESFPHANSVIIEGVILYEDTRKPASNATILLTDEKGSALKTTRTDKDGYYKFSNLEEDNTYKIILHQGNLTNNSEDRKYLAEKVHVKGSDANVSRQLFENIFFDFDSYALRSEGKKVLDDLVTYCKGDTTIQIELNANTDSYGSSQYNKILAGKRGKTAMDYLLSKGLKQSSMVVNAFGEGKAVASNDSELGRQMNRRIEFYILGGGTIVSNTVTMVIETNKTVYSLAKEYNMTVEELKDLNGLVGDELVAYTPIRVKRRPADHDIHGTPVLEDLEEKDKKLEEKLLARNDSLNRNFDYNREEYKKYLDSISLAEKLKTTGSKGQNTGYYTAQPGNTIKHIAHLYGITEEDIKAINNLEGDTVKISRKIRIDYTRKSPEAQGYIVREGDTLVGIARRFQLDLDVLIEVNKLPGYILSPNMVIRFQY